MPKSKRDKKVSLTKTTKKGKAMYHQLIENIRKHLEEFHHVYVFTVHNMRNCPLKKVRENWIGSRFVFGKNKIMAVALGQDAASEAQKNVHKLAKQLSGQCGLLFTNEPKDYVLEWFRNFSKMDFAKSGFVATRTVTLPVGPLPDFSHSIETHLRTLGLPTRLEKGTIVLREEYTVCTEGARLKPEEASILKLLGKKMAEFKISLVCVWSKDGSFEKLKVRKHTPKEMKKVSKKVGKPIRSEEDTPVKENITNKQPSTPVEEIIRPMISLTTSEVDKTCDEDVEMSQEQNKTPQETKTSEKGSPQLSSVTSMDDELHDATSDVLSPKFGKSNPRRSMRTPKPIKRTPEQSKQSVKKLTVTAKKLQRNTPRGTPKKSKEQTL